MVFALQGAILRHLLVLLKFVSHVGTFFVPAVKLSKCHTIMLTLATQTSIKAAAAIVASETLRKAIHWMDLFFYEF